ncbi:general transcription factor 3C polypeptide 5 [Clupea harengus]|uniref:General transcription factor 3C polypeptide 5 n=1 Tax=Clupea harengus TaxID=7950 RepID=A0A6P3VZT1_CLUHA|nr:general transcription factor 3C polypeptide 5 [Clupea harengus]
MASDVSNSLNSRLPQDDEPNGAANTNAPANINAPVITGNSATVSLPDNRLVCVEYPGFVINVDKMLDTIGGEKGVSKTYSDSTKRLELRYRPKDPYCHPVYGNRYPSTNLLLRIRRRVRKGNSQDVQISMEILGVIETTYKFQAMADIQYLAAHSEPDKSWTSLYNKVILRQPEKKEFFDQDVPLFLPPPIFSRQDSTVDYYYRPDIQHKEGYGPPLASSDNLIGLSRARRPHNAIFITFEDKEVPSGPLEAAKANWKKVSIHSTERKAEEEILKLFERRPIWSRNAVKANMDVHPEKLKLLLPFVAYYMLTGPWRSLWVRFGFDPRKNAEAKIYQVLDFRIRCGMKHGYGAGDMPVKAKRSAYHHSLYTTLNKSGPQPASLKEITEESPSTSRKPSQPRYLLKESAFRFHEGMLPPYRQMFYQLCDLEVEQIRSIIHQNDGKEEGCDERDGWCVPRTADELRDIMSAMIKHTVRDSGSGGLYQKKHKKGTNQSGSSKGDYDEDDEDEEEDDEYQPSDGSENEMETEILDYL